MRKRRVAIVGGGAAGLVAAVRAAEVLGERARGAADAGVEVVVYEAADRVGKSILATGNGRCNFSNERIDPALYRNAAFVAESLGALEAQGARTGLRASCDAAFPVCPTAVHRFFAERGLVWRTEGEGRQYPVSGKASAVLDVLRASAAVLGVREACGAAVERIEAPAAAQGGSARGEGAPFLLRFGDGSVECADAVILACGRTVARGLLPVELPFIDTTSVLGPLAVREKKVAKALDGIRVKARAALLRDDAVVAAERGEVLLRSYGVSGIAVFNLSRFAEPGDVLELDLLADALGEAPDGESGGGADGGGRRTKRAEAFLRARRDMLAVRGLAATCEALFDGLLLPAVARMVVKRAGLDARAIPDDAACASLALVLTRFRFVIEGVGDARQCQVHRGGYAVESFDARTMEAREVSGLFAVGEALDVDAPCGGYNLHWAWASGLLAGCAAAERVADDAECGRRR